VSPVVVLTGMSGAGKQTASCCFEDLGWRVVENLPPRLFAPLVSGLDKAEPLCLVCDARNGELDSLLAGMMSLSVEPIVLFLEATDEELVKRFKETRRTHPLFKATSGILPAIAAERVLLSVIKERADLVLDTTGVSTAELKAILVDRFGAPEQKQHPITITVASFGFKHGTPLDADLLFDVRFLKNPYYDPELRTRDGRSDEVQAFVMRDERTGEFLERLYDLVGWSLPHYVREGKAYLTIGIGCTGGKHRSVAIGEKLSQFLSERGYKVLTQHRDVEKK
jgi:RNase adapter protein RapZ